MKIQYYPDKVSGGITGWHWIESDVGAWTGPKNDWEYCHVHIIKNHCRKFRTAIQAGGNLGMYPRLLSRMFEQVYTFEPDPLNFQCLTMNCDKDNIIKMQAALGPTKSACFMNRLSMANVGMHQVTEHPNAIIPVIKCSDVVERNDVDLIMLDMEGYEDKAIYGLVNIIIKSEPLIMVERASQHMAKLLNDIAGYKSIGMSSMDEVFIVP